MTRGKAWFLGGIGLLAALVMLAVLLLQAKRVEQFALGRAGAALGLQIEASGAAEYRLRGTPTIVVRDVTARMPGNPQPLLVADRVLLSLPWSTLHARLQELDFTRIELDSPVLDLGVLQAWQATRPPGDGRIPTLSKGLAVIDGTLVADGWRIKGVDLTLPLLDADQPVRAQASGRYVAGATTLPFDLDGQIERLADGSPLGISGNVTLVREGWQLPARLKMRGTWHAGSEGWGIDRMRLGATATYQAGDTRTPFALGLVAPLRFADGTTSLSPLAVVIRPLDDGLVPALKATGTLALEDELGLELDGTFANWPEAWPALPAPLDDRTADTDFTLDYSGATTLDDVAAISLARDGTRADVRLRLAGVTEWMETAATGTPLPPLEGTATTPRLEIAGATLHGVTITIDDDD